MTAQKTNPKTGNIVNISSYARCTVRPNKLKSQGLEQRKVYCKEKSSFCPKNLNSQKGLDKALLKARWGGLYHRGNTISPQAQRPGAMCSSSLHLLFVEEVIIIFLHMQNSSGNICASNTIFEAVQRSAKAENMGEGLFQEGPCGVLLGYIIKVS